MTYFTNQLDSGDPHGTLGSSKMTFYSARPLAHPASQAIDSLPALPTKSQRSTLKCENCEIEPEEPPKSPRTHPAPQAINSLPARPQRSPEQTLQIRELQNDPTEPPKSPLNGENQRLIGEHNEHPAAFLAYNPSVSAGAQSPRRMVYTCQKAEGRK